MARSLSLTRRTVGDVLVLDVSGDLVAGKQADLMRAEMKKALLDEKAVKMLLNLSQLKRIDSIGLAVLVSAIITAGNRGAQLKLCELRPSIIEVIKAARIPMVWPVRPTEARALASFDDATCI